MKYSRSDRWVICDVCGFKYHAKDVIKINDRYNRHFGLVVCKNDADPTNQQDVPYKYKETIVSDIHKIRPRPDLQFVVNPNDNRLPSAPSNGFARPSTLSNTIDLFWDGPSDSGSSGIITYTIKRASPQLGIETTLISSNNSTYYNDTAADSSGVYSYTLAATNGFGTGPYSAPFFYPSQQVQSDIIYIGVNNGTSVLATSDGTFIVLSPEA